VADRLEPRRGRALMAPSGGSAAPAARFRLAPRQPLRPPYRPRLTRVALVAALVAAVGAGLGWLLTRDPLRWLPAPAGPVVLAAGASGQPGATRLELTLDDPAVGPVRLSVRLPSPLPEPGSQSGAGAGVPRPLPVLLVVSGLASGAETLALIPPTPGVALVGYHWPFAWPLPEGLALLQQAPALYRQALAVPGQLAAALLWLRDQPWADGGRVTLVGISLGGLVAPAAQRLAAARGAAPGWTVLGYAGAPLAAVIGQHPAVRRLPLGPLLAEGLGLALRPLEPALHLPHLTGHFLLIGATDDLLVSPAAFERYLERLQGERRVVRVAGPHVAPDQEVVLSEVVAAVRRWLVEQGVVVSP